MFVALLVFFALLVLFVLIMLFVLLVVLMVSPWLGPTGRAAAHNPPRGDRLAECRSR
jgi:hypothetical protein